MTDEPEPGDPTPAAPRLPDVQSPPRATVLDGMPSEREVIDGAASVEEITSAQPSVDELLGREAGEHT